MELLDLYLLADKEGITVDAFDLGERQALSVQDAYGYYIAIDPFRLETTAEEKTQLGHEMGHCVTGSLYNKHSSFDIRQRHENRADKWAIKKLVPKAELDIAVADGYTEIWDLAERFGVTEDFMRKAVCWYKYGVLEVKSIF